MSAGTHVVHLLDDYVDGLLSEAEESDIRRHLNECPPCAHELERLTSLLAAVRDVPDAIDPPRDLWPGIERRITHSPVRASRGWTLNWRWAMAGTVAAAAAMTVIVAEFPSVWQETGPVTGPVTAHDDGSIGPPYVASLVRALDVQCVGAGKQLLAMHASRALGPETAETVGRSVTILDAAITETSSALEQQPNDPELLRKLITRYEQKLSLLHQATRLAGET